MREILFRAKRLDNGEWVEGFYCNLGGKYHYILTGMLDITKGYPEFVNHQIDPTTGGQFTGMWGKNGKRVFEGDIVSTDLERPYLIVEFRDGCFMFNCNDKGEDYYDIMLPILKEPQTVYKYGEVIGNIHDNPELLEVTPDE